MQLKDYQQQALDRLERWLHALEETKKSKGNGNAVSPETAWRNMEAQDSLPRIEEDDGVYSLRYNGRAAASGALIPHACMKIPTGGGKTLLGAEALKRILPDTGFALWIVPTRAIYEQTIKACRTREHPCRQILERGCAGKLKLLQKNDGFAPEDVANRLCVMMLMLPAANRKKGKDFLKINRSSGAYMNFFPADDDAKADRQLLKLHPDLDKSKRSGLVLHSLANVLKVLRPVVILDEAHKAYGKREKRNEEFVDAVNRLNPRLVLELSATPRLGKSNILVNVSGTDLHAEEMIKLPIEIRSLGNSDWKHTLAKAKEKRDALEREARKLQARENRHIRPIALVRVQQTGEAQRGKGKIHSEDVREYLKTRLRVPEAHIRVQSSDKKELAGEDLPSERCPVRWIVTKDALKEGWDCSFAYVLALLDNTKAPTAMTQMAGRVMRQPHARRIGKAKGGPLDRCYIYCYNQDVAKAVERVKEGLEREGLTGLGGFIGAGGLDAPKPIVFKRRREYKKLPIFLPQVLHKDKGEYRLLDYDRDILAGVNWERLSKSKQAPEENLGDENTMRIFKTAVSLQKATPLLEESLGSGDSLRLEYFVLRLADVVPNPWLAARIVKKFLQAHRDKGHDDAKLLNHRLDLSEILRRRLIAALDKETEELFRTKVKKNEIRFRLETDEVLGEALRYELKREFETSVANEGNPLLRQSGEPMEKSLFEPVCESGFNRLEKDCALYLESREAIYWWHKIAARQEYCLQGWRRRRVFPDFVACRGRDNGQILILETKGLHLKGSDDTEYKRKLLEVLEGACNRGIDRGEMAMVGASSVAPEGRAAGSRSVFRMLFADTWKEELNRLIPR